MRHNCPLIVLSVFFIILFVHRGEGGWLFYSLCDIISFNWFWPLIFFLSRLLNHSQLIMFLPWEWRDFLVARIGFFRYEPKSTGVNFFLRRCLPFLFGLADIVLSFYCVELKYFPLFHTVATIISLSNAISKGILLIVNPLVASCHFRKLPVWEPCLVLVVVDTNHHDGEVSMTTINKEL